MKNGILFSSYDFLLSELHTEPDFIVTFESPLLAFHGPFIAELLTQVAAAVLQSLSHVSLL